MTVERQLNGSVVVSEMIAGHRVSRVYYGYTKKEAMRAFAAEYGLKKRGKAA